LEENMIRHIVLFSARRTEDIPAIIEGLRMLGTIEGVKHFEVARNNRYDQLSQEMDVVLYAEFTDAAALDAYKQHPTYERCIEVVRPLRDQRIAIDYDTQEAQGSLEE
jgi:quinol monooxygenase YgiN